MKARSKMDPVKKYKNWTKEEKGMLKKMVNEGRSINEIAGLIGRTRDDVSYHKNLFGYKKTTDRVEAKKKNKANATSVSALTSKTDPTTTRDQARTMARAARDIARANGKRITMSIFFVEDL